MNLLNLSQQKLVPNDFPSHGESPPHPVPGLPAPMGVSGCRASPAAGFICAEMSQKPSNLLLGYAPKHSVGELPTRELPFPIPFLPHFPWAPSASCPCTARATQVTEGRGQCRWDLVAPLPLVRLEGSGIFPGSSCALGMPGSPECALCHPGPLERCPLLRGADGGGSASTGCPRSSTGAVASTTSLISLSSSSCTKGTFGDMLIREKRGRRAGKGAAQSLGQHLVQDTLRLVSWTATGDGSVAIPCTHLVLQHLQGSRTLVQPWPLGRCP